MPLFGGIEEAFDPTRLTIAVIVGVIAVIGAAVILRALLAVVALIEDELANYRESRRPAVFSPWYCGTCRSLNSGEATYCYRGCGRRSDTEVVLVRPH